MRSRQHVTSRRHAVVGFGALFVAAFSVPAFAQSSGGGAAPLPYPAACSASSVSAGESESAHKLYAAGKVQYDESNYDAAIQLFRDAYKRDCSKHDLLVIISRANELKNDKAEAIRALETYLEREPKSPDAATHRARVENLKQKLALAPPPTVAPTVTPPPSATPTTTPPPPAEVREHTVPPWILVGVGGAAILAGVSVIIAAPKIPANCDPDTGTCTVVGTPAPPGTPAATVQQTNLQKSRDKAGQSVGMKTAGTIMIIGGSGVLVAGLLWHFLEPTGPVSSSSADLKKPKLTPSFSPAFAGVTLGASF